MSNWLISDSWIFSLEDRKNSSAQAQAHFHPLFSESFSCFCRLTPLTFNCMCLPFPKGFNFNSSPLLLLLLSLPPCLRNQTQVCHCWGSNHGNPQAQLQKEPLKTTLSTVLATQPATTAGRWREESIHLPSPVCFSFSYTIFTQLVSLSALNVPQLNSSIPPCNKCSLPCPYQHTYLQGREEWERNENWKQWLNIRVEGVWTMETKGIAGEREADD